MSNNHRSKQENYSFVQSDEAKIKISNALSGRKLSYETKMKMSGPRKPQPQVICPFCGKVGGNSTMQRWHFDNCKDRK